MVWLLFGPPTLAAAQTINQFNTEYSSSTAELIIEAYAVHAGIPYKPFIETAKCESDLNADAINPTDGHGGSRGVFQFQTSTFNKYKTLAGVSDGDVFNPFDNIQVAAYMFSIGEQHQWSCYRKLH